MKRIAAAALACCALGGGCERRVQPLPQSQSAPAVSMPATRAPERADDDPQQAARVIDRYYAAIASHDYETAYGLWVDGGPPGQSLAQFIAGFEDTATVRVERGTAGRIGAAAGSRYIDVPVVIEATDKSGGKQRFEGTYTLRRSVVDGATPSQRTWHIYRGSIRRQIPP